MSTLYLDRRDAELRRDGASIAVYESGTRRSTVPLKLLERVVIRAETTLSSGLLGILAEHDVGVLVLSGRQGHHMAVLLGRPHADAARRYGQYRWYEDPGQRVAFAWPLVLAKLRAQRRLLREAQAARPDCRHGLTTGIKGLERAVASLRDDRGTGFTIDGLRGIEGAAAAAYFKAFTTLFAGSLGFTGRNRRPPRDPVNAGLSLGYTLLHFEAVRACHMAGLDPLLGLYHEPAYNRESLATDMIEPLRPRLDGWLWGLFRTRTLREDHFSTDRKACLLGKAGRKAFYTEYEPFARPIRRLLRRSSQRLARRLAEGFRQVPE